MNIRTYDYHDYNSMVATLERSGRYAVGKSNGTYTIRDTALDTESQPMTKQMFCAYIDGLTAGAA